MSRTHPSPLSPSRLSPSRTLTFILAAVLTAVGAVVVTPSSGAAAASSSVSSIIPRESSGWQYSYSNTAPAADWRTVKQPWPSGTAPLGRGSRAAATTELPVSSGRQPLSAFFRKSFTLTSDLPEWSWLNTWADDGIVVWVNGVEIGRKNAPNGTITPSSYSTVAPSSTAARRDPVTFKVPRSLFKVGENTIAVQVLSSWRKTPDISFDGHLVREDDLSAADAPTTPKPEAPEANGPSEGAPDGSVAGWGTPDWRDEFSYVDSSGRPAVDPTKWNVRDREDLGLLFDAAVVEREQVSVDDAGVLHVRADWLDKPVERPSGQRGPSQLWHKTGYLDQRGLEAGDVSREQRYGRWEIRAKTPTGPNTLGALAAFWLRNDNSGEIDIMEAWGQGSKMSAEYNNYVQDTAATTIHTKTDGSGSKRLWRHAEQGATAVPWDGFHTYAFELTPTYAATFVDGVQVMRVTPDSYPELWNASYFNSPLHMRINLHVGPSATYWGLPDPARKSETQNLDYQVDYVRTWAYTGK